MRRLFVDVDDCLIIYQDHKREFNPHGVLLGVPYNVNEGLVKRIQNFDGLIIIWSGGGYQYANQIAMEVLRDTVHYMTMTKDKDAFFMIRDGDIVVDDQKIEVPVKVYGPEEEWV